jgi:hypothetical protein
MYGCVCAGIEHPVTKKKYYRCILADEMGLGTQV